MYSPAGHKVYSHIVFYVQCSMDLDFCIGFLVEFSAKICLTVV